MFATDEVSVNVSKHLKQASENNEMVPPVYHISLFSEFIFTKSIYIYIYIVLIFEMSDLLLGQAVSRFEEEYGRAPRIAVFAPGRVNLIGEHTDYNDGYVLPFALPFRTIIVGDFVPPSSLSRLSSIVSCNISNPKECSATFTIDENLTKGEPKWSNYVRGTVKQYVNDLPKDAAFQAVVISDVPIGSGLSSSASLEVATATFLEDLYNIKLAGGGVEKALRCQKAEHTFADMPCGIMDQYCSAMGQQGSLLLLDCRSYEFQLVKINSKVTVDDARKDTKMPSIVICNSNVKHSLSGSEYPDRVRQCKEAVLGLQSKYPEIKALRDATIEQLDSIEHAKHDDNTIRIDSSSKHEKYSHSSDVPTDKKVNLKQKVKIKKKISSFHSAKEVDHEAKDNHNHHILSEVAYRRAHHCITEDIRTIQTAKSLENGDFITAGKLMTQSHLSLQHDFEVSCDELDLLVSIAVDVPGVYGSRMTGGGFGGCTVTLVETEKIQDLTNTLKESYPACECYIATPSSGAGILDLSSALPVVTHSVSRYGSAADTDGDPWPSTADEALLYMLDNPWYTTTAAIALAAVVSMVLTRRR